MNAKSALGFSIVAIVISATTSILSIGTILMTYAEETASSQENVTGTQNTTGISCNGDDKGEIGEVPGEDDNDPGDIDVNDAEDSC